MTGEKAAKQKITAADVREIVGHLEDDVVVDIIATGADAEEVMEAFVRFSGNTSLGEDLEKPAGPIVLQVIEILSRDQDLEDEA